MKLSMINIRRKIENLYLLLLCKPLKHVYLKLGKDSYLPYNSEIKTAVEIGDGTGINGKIRIVGGARVMIGKYCAIGSDVKIISSNHDITKANLQSKFATDFFNQSIDVLKGETKIGNNVWIGDSVIILPGVQVGDGAVLGAGSIVTKNIPPFAIAVGNPAKVIKFRFSQKIIKKLLKISWWDWPINKIILNKNFLLLILPLYQMLKLSDY